MSDLEKLEAAKKLIESLEKTSDFTKSMIISSINFEIESINIKNQQYNEKQK